MSSSSDLDESPMGVYYDLSSNKTKHVCLICGKEFNRRWGLTQHLMLHQDHISFGCGGCDLGFNRVRELSQYVREHSKDDSIKYYECLMCGKSFIRPGNLSTHAKLHYEAPSKKTYTCKVCGSEYTQSSSLKRHMVVHLHPIKCSECTITSKVYEYMMMYKRRCHPSKGINSEQIDMKRESSKHEETLSSNNVNLDEEI